jgi:hypothetical protein
MAPAGMEEVVGEANAPAEVESCNAEEVIMSDHGGMHGARAVAARDDGKTGAGGNPRSGRPTLIPSQKIICRG